MRYIVTRNGQPVEWSYPEISGIEIDNADAAIRFAEQVQSEAPAATVAVVLKPS